MRRAILYSLLAILVIGAVAGGVYWRSLQTQEATEEFRSAVAEQGAMIVAVSASGSVEPLSRVSLAFEAPGEVIQVPVAVGERVMAGDVLARLDTTQLALQVQQAKATLALAEAQLTQLQEGAREGDIAAAEANVRAAAAQVSAAAANRDQTQTGPSAAEIASAEAQIAAMELQHRVTLIAHDRTMLDSDDEEKKKQASYDLYAADKALAAAQTQLDELLTGADADAVRAAQANVEVAQAQQDAAQAQLDLLLAGALEEQVVDVQAQIAQAQAALELTQLSLEKATLYAPFDGVVAAIDVAVGEMASTLPTVALLNVSQFRDTIRVDEIDVDRLKPGQSAQVVLDAFPDVEIPGVIKRVAPAATIEGGVVYYDVLIELDSTDIPIRADMTANATIVVEQLSDVLKIPTWVVRVDQGSGQTYVHRRAGEDLERVDVALGVRYEGVVQVLGGLSEGDELVWLDDSTPFGFGNQ